MEERTVNYHGTPVFYRTTGKGNPVILLHGFGEDGNIWQQQADYLKDHFKLIIPDIPGSGRSGFIQQANIETYAEVTKLIADATIREASGQNGNSSTTISLVGHSMGGYIALAFAEKYPDVLSSFGLFHSSAFKDNPEKIQARQKAIKFIESNGSHAFFQTSTPALFTKPFAEQNPDRVDALVEAGKNFPPEAIIQYYQAMIGRPDRTAVLKEFSRPILFIIGEHDTAIPLQTSLEQCYLPSRSHVHILQNSAHMGMWEEPAECNRYLLDFLKQSFEV